MRTTLPTWVPEIETKPAPMPLLVVLADGQHAEDVVSALQAGAHGYVQKSRAGRDLIGAIEVLLAGGTFFGPAAGSAG